MKNFIFAHKKIELYEENARVNDPLFSFSCDGCN